MSSRKRRRRGTGATEGPERYNDAHNDQQTNNGKLAATEYGFYWYQYCCIPSIHLRAAAVVLNPFSREAVCWENDTCKFPQAFKQTRKPLSVIPTIHSACYTVTEG